MGKVIIGIIGIIIGFFLVWKADWIMQNFGRTGWAEEHLGSEGGSRIFYKLIGLGIIIISFIIMFGLTEGILRSIFSPMLPKQ